MRIYKCISIKKSIKKNRDFLAEGKPTWNPAASKQVFWGVKMLKMRSIYSVILKFKPTNK